MLMMKAGVFRPRRLVSLRKLGDGFTRIAAAPSGELTIGALAPLSALEHSPEVARHAPVIVRAMKRLSNVRVRNVATVGGALAHGDPHMDLPPVLIALNASVAIAGPDGRTQPGGRGPADRLLRNRACQERTDHRIAHPGAGRSALGLFQSHRRLRRRLAGARRRGRAGRRRRARQIRPHRGERGDGQGHAAEIRRAGADRRRMQTTRRLQKSPKPPRRKPTSSPTCAARRPTSANCCASMPRARCAPPSTERPDGRAHDHRRTGRPLAAAHRGAREGHRPRRIHPHHAVARHAACQDLPQHGGARSHQVDRHRRPRAKCPASMPSTPATTCAKSSPIPITARPSTTSRSSPSARCILSASRSRSCWPADPHVAEQAAQEIVAEYEELPAVFDEVEAAENKTLVHDELKPAGTFADLKHLKAARAPISRSISACGAATSTRPSPRRPGVRAHLPHPEGAASRRSSRYASIADYRDDGVTIYSSAQGPSFVRTEIARLLGWPENRVRIKVPYLGGGYGGKLYIKLEALAVALSMLARRPVKIALTMEEQFLHHHQTSQHVPHQERPRQGWPHRRAQMRGSGGTAAPMPTSARA